MADKPSTGEAPKPVLLTAAAKKAMPETYNLPSAFAGEEKPENPDRALGQPTAYSMRPAFGEMFPLPTIKHIMNTVMAEKLKDKTYDKDVAKTWTSEIADAVNQQIATSAKVKRYKHVVQVMIGQELGAGATYNSRCCWDCDCDTSVSEVFSNTSLFCVCTVFGTYQY
ncbi:dynein light chain Tctex-type protein 2B [Drosophila kikkawai]|uniref:Dynein light chain Tctex-type protein 2B n=1 Tax=Drosophila kikkawai TaxID=30033 RepID=A0A6P4JML2_DROKI|nr:dynein light chain Tctex-type protein 2B [Drosophila kikkawai]